MNNVNNVNQSDQIGVEEIRRRVDAAIGETLAELAEQPEPPADGKSPGVRDLVRPRLDADVLGAIQREGLIRFVRRVQRLNRNRPKPKPKRKAEGEKKVQGPRFKNGH